MLSSSRPGKGALIGLLSVAALLGAAGCTALGHSSPTASTGSSTGSNGSSAATVKVSAAPNRTADSNGDGVGSFKLCDRGTYPAFAVFVLDGRARSETVRPGGCATRTFKPSTTWHRVEIYGIDTDRSTFQIGVDSFGSQYDERVKTTGTDQKPDWFSF
jgi:hypothetical protein